MENLEDNESNIGEVEKHLRISAVQVTRAGDLLREFYNFGFL